MGGTWTSQNKELPGVYINFEVNKPLGIAPGDRGVVVLPLKISDTEGTVDKGYKITVGESDLKDAGVDAPEAEGRAINQALKNASTVIAYNIGLTPSTGDITKFLSAMNTVDFNTIGYIYEDAAVMESIATWVKGKRDEGKAVQAVVSGYAADDRSIINVGNGVKLATGVTLTAFECCAFVAGATAGARMNQSLTNFTYTGGVDVEPRLSKSEMETAVKAGKFIFKANGKQRVSCVYDINSAVGGDTMFRKNRLLRVIDNVNNDIQEIFESNYSGKMNNNDEGRSLLKASIIDYMRELERLNCIENFDVEDVNVKAGMDKDEVLIDCFIQPVDSAEKFYITVNVK